MGAIYWDAFFVLRRGLDNMSLIPWRDVQYWCDTHEFGPADSVGIHKGVAVLDNAFVEHMVGKHNAEAKAQEAKANANKRR